MISPDPLQIYSFGDLVADRNRMQVRRGEQPLDLEPKALRVLFHLIENRDRIVSKDELFREVWAGAFVTDNALTRVIAQLRRELGDNARSPLYIETAANAGYRFVAEVRLPEPGHVTHGEAAQAVVSTGPLRRPARRRVAVAAALLLAAAILAGTAWRLYRNGRQQPPAMVALQQITTAAALDRYPSFSPDGSQLAFTSDRTGHFEIYTRSVAPGSSDRQITFDDHENIQPAWSPNGESIAYTSVNRGGVNILPASGGPVRYRTNFGDTPQWSPDGQWLVFRNTGRRDNAAQDPIDVPQGTLWLVGAEHGEPFPLTTRGNPAGGHENPRWLPDSRHVVFEDAVLVPPTTPRPEFKVFVIDMQTRQLQAIPLGDLRARNPIVSPDGRYLYFDVRFGQRPGLWRVRTDPDTQAGAPELVMPSNGPLLRDLAFAHSGNRLAFSQSTDESALWSVLLSANGSPRAEPRPLIRERVRLLTQPLFSPDGKKIAYTWTQRDTEWVKMAVYIANADGSATAALTSADEQGFGPSWTGKDEVGFEVSEKQGASYWVKRLNEAPRRTNLQLDWSRSDNVRLHGTKVVADVATATGSQVVVADLEGGPPVPLTPVDRNISRACWSHDGRWIAAQEVVNGESRLVIFPASGGEITTVVGEPTQSYAYDWSPDDQRISFAGLRNGVWNIYWVDRSTGKVKQLTHFNTPSASVDSPAWSPRGDEIVFERYDQLANIYVADLH